MPKRLNSNKRRVDRPSPMGGVQVNSSFVVNGGGMIPAGTKLNVPQTSTYSKRGRIVSKKNSD